MGRHHTADLMTRHLLTQISEAVWQPTIWLPPNSTWSDIELPEKAQFGHLAYPLPLAFILMVLRFFLDRAVYRPVGKALGVKNKKRRQPTPNPVLEAAFQCGKLDYKSLCSHTGLSDRQISVWMRLRNHVGKSVLCLPGQVLHSH